MYLLTLSSACLPACRANAGLSELYEADYLKKALGLENDESDKKKKVTLQLFDKLCDKLNALSNFHFIPKKASAELEVSERTPTRWMLCVHHNETASEHDADLKVHNLTILWFALCNAVHAGGSIPSVVGHGRSHSVGCELRRSPSSGRCVRSFVRSDRGKNE